MTKTVIIGAGAMGLAAAHYALKSGHEVEVVEADRVPGGMAAHFDFDGISIERFYHFICKADASTFALMKDLDIQDLMRWRPTSMGYFIDGILYPWGDPISLLKFPKLDLISKFRYGAQAFFTTKRKSFDDIEDVSARTWIEKGAGKKVYDLLWRRLMELKFYEYADNVSAAWIATRIKRIGTSRQSIFQEELGYIEGGSETLVKALVSSIERQGGKIHLGMPAERVTTDNGRVSGVIAGGKLFPAEAVIATVPTPYINDIVPDLPDASKKAYAAIENIGVVCVLHKLKRPVTKHFWVNVIDKAMPIPGIIEFSNLRPLPESIVYIPYYMPTTNPKFTRDNEMFITESFECLKQISPSLTDSDRISSYVGRLRYAQPMCQPGFAATLPPIRTPIEGLQIADTCSYYPEDRGISESVRVAGEMVRAIGTSYKPSHKPEFI